MENLLKLLGGSLIIWLVMGGKGVFDKGSDTPRAPNRIKPDTSQAIAPPTPPAMSAASLDKREEFIALPSRRHPPFEIETLDYLLQLGSRPLVMEKVHVTYYVRDQSTRCHFDSLPPCLQDHIIANDINVRDFQYAYFFDRVLDSGSGVLTWEMREYFVQFEALRKYGWGNGKRNFSNDYSCGSFSYRSKRSVEFIQDNFLNRELFVPLETLRYPNGQTASGQPAIDWQTLAINLTDFPLSVPDAKRRESWAKRAAANGKRPPRARVFLVLEFPNGRKFLTEASDTGSGLRSRTVDWRIGNTNGDIAYMQTLGSEAKATAFMFDDASITFQQVWARSRKVQ